MQNGILQFSTTICLLSDFLETVYHYARKRTKRSVAGVQLSKIGCSSFEEASFFNCKQALKNQFTLAHRSFNHRLGVRTVTSDLLWSGIVTQVFPSDLSQPYDNRRHSTLAFFRAIFLVHNWDGLRAKKNLLP